MFINKKDEKNFFVTGFYTIYFNPKIKAKYYCESLHTSCSGVTFDGQFYTARHGTELRAKQGTKTWTKGNWCSTTLPPLSIRIPTIFNIGSKAKEKVALFIY